MKSARLRGWIPRVFAYLLCIGCAAAAHAEERQRVTVVAFNVLAPTGNREATPLTGRVIDFAVWSIEDEIERIEENMRRDGSDHFPIEAVIEIPVP
jgi:hypothetical protein